MWSDLSSFFNYYIKIREHCFYENPDKGQGILVEREFQAWQPKVIEKTWKVLKGEKIRHDSMRLIRSL